jgi:serine/threonine protein kinase/tetratricopeptide (TPR) repeat protein
MATERLAQPINFGKYELVGRIAHGRMGDAYKAKSHGVEGFEKIFVIKIFHPALTVDPTFVETVIEEAKRTVTLAHANVAQVFDLGLEEESGQYYVAQEYVSGFDLKRIFRFGEAEARPLPQELAVFIAGEICKGLDYAHRRKDYNFNNLNLVHGDLKPGNVIVSFDGDVKLTDFGMGRALKMTPELDNEDAIMRCLYTAPEVAQGNPATQRSDAFALGLLMYELLCGKHPYRHADPETVRNLAARAEITPASSFPNVPRPVASLIDALLVTDPAARSTTAGQAYEELAGYIFGNNLRADSRALALYMQELRRLDQRAARVESTVEFGLQEISLSEIQVLSDEHSGVADETNAELPSYKIAQAMGKDVRPPLPGALEEIFRQVRGGQGKAVLVSGSLGSGRHHLADRLKDAVGWRGNATACAIQTTEDDRFSPFGVLSDVVLEILELDGRQEEALDRLRDMGVDDSALATLAGIWSLDHSVNVGGLAKRTHLRRIFDTVLDSVTAAGPFALVIDRVERLDFVSLDVLRHIVAGIGERSLMLVMCTEAPEQMRASFDLGRPENLEALTVTGESGADLSSIRGLTDDAARILTTLALGGIVMTQADLGQIQHLPADRVVAAARELIDKQLIRGPETGTFLGGVDGLYDWVLATMPRADVEALAKAIARHFKHLARKQPRRFTPTILRFLAIAGNRRDMVRGAQAHAHWLENQGWYDSALEYYQAAADLVAANRLGAPHSRIGFLLNRSELALQLARLDISRASLEPITTLSEMVRSDVGVIRGQLLAGQMALQQDDLVDAQISFRRALEAARAINDPNLTALAMLALARWYDRFGDLVAAQRMIEGAMNLFQHGGVKMDLNSRALLLNRAVRLYSERGMTLRAQTLSADLTALAKSTHLPGVRCRATWATSLIAAARGDWKESHSLLSAARIIAEEHGLTALRIEILREEAAAALEAGEVSQASELAADLIQQGSQHDDFYSAQRGHDIAAVAQCMSGQDVEGALEQLNASLTRSKERQVPRDIQRSHVVLGAVYRRLGRLEEAKLHEGAAADISSRLRYSAAA